MSPLDSFQSASPRAQPSITAPIAIPDAMDEPRFWTLIDTARGSDDPTARSATPSNLKRALEELDDAELAAFQARFSAVLVSLNSWEIWDAGSALAQDMSDDSFHYFRSWLIGKGRAAVAQAVLDPDGLTPYLRRSDAIEDGFDNESLEYVAIDELQTRTDEDTANDFLGRVAAETDSDPVGEPGDELSIAARFPRLTAWAVRFGG